MQQAGHNTKTVPQDQCKLRHLFTLLAQLHQSSFSSRWLHKIGNPLQDSPVVVGDLLVDAIGPLLVHGAERSVGGLIIVVLSGIVVLVDRDTSIVLLLSGLGGLRLLLSVVQALVRTMLVSMLRPSILLLGEMGLIGMLGLNHRVYMGWVPVKPSSSSSHFRVGGGERLAGG